MVRDLSRAGFATRDRGVGVNGPLYTCNREDINFDDISIKHDSSLVHGRTGAGETGLAGRCHLTDERRH